jgi:7-cyano-7-deazaguanine synthase
MQKIVMGLSGGMDSATLLGILLEQGLEVHCCTFFYGSKHNVYENRAAADLVMHYQGLGFPVFGYYFDLSNAFKHSKSALLLTGGEIPEGHYEAESMKQTVVPGRNLIFSATMASLAESIGAASIALGVHSGDHAIYPDCRPAFIQSLDLTIQLSTEGKVKVITPLLNDNKASILKKGYLLSKPVPYHLTRTCYKEQELSCGKCGSCQERLEAFKLVGKKDPIQYEDNER